MNLWQPQQFEESETWSVSSLTAYIRELFAIDYRLKDVTVTGELSNFRPARSGHLYFTLKDEKAQIAGVMWKTAAARLSFSPGDGDAVLVRGRVSVYEAGGNYQLYADSIQPVGRGNLALAFERLKQQLHDEGLFDPVHKKPIPTLPRKLGIVTSADAAALRDILNVLRRRFPLVQVLIAPTLVQGADAPPQIVRALRWLDGRPARCVRSASYTQWYRLKTKPVIPSTQPRIRPQRARVGDAFLKGGDSANTMSSTKPTWMARITWLDSGWKAAIQS